MFSHGVWQRTCSATADAAPATMVFVEQAFNISSASAGANSNAFIFTLTATLHIKLAVSL
jgi:hypothetical protein